MIKKLTFVGIFSLAVCLVYAFFALQVDNSLSNQDIAEIKKLSLDTKCEDAHASYNMQVACLSAIQKSVQEIGELKCSAPKESVEPAAYVERGYGCCVSRSRFIEKTARYYGFESRHVFLIQPAFGLSLTNLLPLGQTSHAASDFLTYAGWLGVDSNEPYMLIDQDGTPYSYRSALNEKRTLLRGEFYHPDVDFIAGLYSRHGMFYGPNFPGPEFEITELLYNFSND